MAESVLALDIKAFSLIEIARHIRLMAATNHAVILPDALNAYAGLLEAFYARDKVEPATEAVDAAAEAPKVEPTADEMTAEKAGEEVAEAVRAALAKKKVE